MMLRGTPEGVVRLETAQALALIRTYYADFRERMQRGDVAIEVIGGTAYPSSQP